MRLLLAAALAAAAASSPSAPAQDKKGTAVELGGLKSTTPADWKEEALPAKSMRMNTFKLPKADGDPEDADLGLFFFRGNAGTIQQNLERQEKKFELPAGTKPEDAIKVEKLKVGTFDGVYQDIRGTYLKKTAPFDPNAKTTKVENYRQLYVIFETKDGQYYMTLVGPAKTVEKHKKGFDEWLKNFK
ncbi:MAG: hypothetical protein C0501_15515 [Isosphaera sp.]|nr:hypothetical protein [Isosphaera sp.]